MSQWKIGTMFMELSNKLLKKKEKKKAVAVGNLQLQNSGIILEKSMQINN